MRVTPSVAETPSEGGEVSRDDARVRDLLGAAFEWLQVGVVVVGADGVIALVNRELERLFGYTAAELVGRSVDILVPDGARAHHAEWREAFFRDPRPRPIGAGRELFGRRKDGAEVPIEIGLTPLPFGATSFVLASIIDIGERRRLQNELRTERDERLQFDALIGELGAQFVNLHPDEVDRTLEEALGRIVRSLELDRSALFEVADESDDFVHTHQWTRPGWASPQPRVSARQQFPWHLAQIRAGEVVSFATLDDVPNEIDRESLRRLGTKSSVTVPLVIGGRTWGAVSFGAVRTSRLWTADVIQRLRVVATLFANVLARKRGDAVLRRTVAEYGSVRDRLRDENDYLRRELKTLTGAPAIVGHSAAIRRVLEQIRQVAPTETTVLLHGETGTGKALLAGRIHELSGRNDHAMVRVNCASLSAASIERELFGSERGAYTETESRHIGRLALANGSTIFFDEVADLPLEAQASLTRVLQERQIQPLGSAHAMKVDVRIIAATRRELTRAIANGSFRDDLFYHLNVFPISVPPLRERREDIPMLVWRFVDEFSAAFGKPVDAVDQETMSQLQQHTWPGNARELRNVVERALIVSIGRRLRIALPPSANGSGTRRKR